ncbi:MAG: Na/Pi cotransporter family protein [Bacteroidia bacterium]|nr:Na/Pi cotransporter family protein [Bacteroidia bacterium]
MDLLDSIFKLLAGIGLFLFAMYLLEESLKNLSGRNFKRFLQKITKTTIGAASGGALVTAVLQSSSMVSVMVLAFVGAGVFTTKSAMAIILGANLGTTLDSWMVATLGFTTNIEVIAYPAVCVGGLLLILFGKHAVSKYIAYFLFGFGLLFIALSFMRSGMETQVKNLNLQHYSGMSVLLFLGAGFLITLLVQSSSVTMALTLTALNAHALPLNAAAAIVLGSETGTTMKIILGAISGNASKKRVVLGNLLFNVFLTIMAFIFLTPILKLITDVLQVENPLLQLVSFSSLINLLGLCLFLPFLKYFSDFLSRFFKDTNEGVTVFIENANVNEPQTCLDLFEKETEFLIYETVLFNASLFDIKPGDAGGNAFYDDINLKRAFYKRTDLEKFTFLKQVQGALQALYMQLVFSAKSPQQIHINQLNSSVRNAINSANELHGMLSNLSNLKRSSKDIKFNLFLQHQTETELFYQKLLQIIFKKNVSHFLQLKTMLTETQNAYSNSLNNFYKNARTALLDDSDLSIVVNFNHALFTSNRALIMAVKDLLLPPKEAEMLNDIPVYMS